VYGKCISTGLVELRPPVPEEAEVVYLILQKPSLHPNFMGGSAPTDLSLYTDRVRRAETDPDRIAWWISGIIVYGELL